MICKKCGNAYNENESIFCPKRGEQVTNDNVQNEYKYNSQVNGQPIASDDGMTE